MLEGRKQEGLREDEGREIAVGIFLACSPSLIYIGQTRAAWSHDLRYIDLIVRNGVLCI